MPTSAFVLPNQTQAAEPQDATVLVVSADLESRRSLVTILEGLCSQVMACSTVGQVTELFHTQTPNMIFSEDRLPDGAYADVLGVLRSRELSVPLVVMTRTGEWDLYTEATRLGALNVIRSPWLPTDVELNVIRGLRESTAGAVSH